MCQMQRLFSLHLFVVWRGVDSNHRRSGTDRFTVCCRWPLGYPSGGACLFNCASPRLDFVAGGGIRTRDLLITNQVLYQLSYTGKVPNCLRKPATRLSRGGALYPRVARQVKEIWVQPRWRAIS